MFEGLLGDNYLFEDVNECIEWIFTVINDEEDIDDFIQLKDVEDVYDRLCGKIINAKDKELKVLRNFLIECSDETLPKIYYKNNLIEFIKDHDEIKDLIITVFENIENLEYATDKETWFECVPKKYVQDFTGKDMDKWNNFVNKQYFMDPNDIPRNVETELFLLKEYILKYVFCKYISFDRVYRLKNFTRKCVTIIDTDSNILAIDTVMNYIMNDIVNGRSFGRPEKNNEFIAVNLMAYIITHAVEIILLEFGKCCYIPEKYRSLFNMKNEFYFDRLIIGDTKKRYISRILLREGNMMNPPKYDIKGFDFKKSSTAEFAENFFMHLVKKYIINSDEINVKLMISEIMDFKNEIIKSISDGDTSFLPNLAVKEKEAYKNAESQQAYKAAYAWNLFNPNEEINPPQKVSLLKLNIFEEKDALPLKETNPDLYEIMIRDIFHDKTGLFVKMTIEPKMQIVDVKNPKWYNNIPKKYRAKYKKLGPQEWNSFIDSFVGESLKELEDQEVIESCSGLQTIAIPVGKKVPKWIVPFIDFQTITNNIMAPFIPILEIFRVRIMEEGRRHGNVDRTSDAITNIIKM